MLCDYSHPSFKGWIELLKKKEKGIFIGCAPEFDANYASECIGLICFVTIQSLKAFVDAFRAWFTMGLLAEADKLMPKILEMVTRYFEVRVYDKNKMSGSSPEK
ncbi:hypothetical protein MUO79_00295 [Candidatus Bathyarchaeota archaeon]|nr:hypothetical protein [Candidatus Bathyarchaeota archaeon]